MDSQRFQNALDRFDAANEQDPRRVTVAGGEEPHELAYARRMTQWLSALAPNASEALQLAVRSQHIRRWEIPRSDYPMTREGYHRWRTDLGGFHAKTAGAILEEVGYEAELIARVQSLLRKENLKSDPDCQTLEDVACLVFLEDEFADFAARHDEAKLLRILRRTWAKMSPRGREAAMGLKLGARERSLIEQALAPPTPKSQG